MIALALVLASTLSRAGASSPVHISEITTGPREEESRIYRRELDELARPLRAPNENFKLTMAVIWRSDGRAYYVAELSSPGSKYIWWLLVEGKKPEEAAKYMADKIRWVLTSKEEAGRD